MASNDPGAGQVALDETELRNKQIAFFHKIKAVQSVRPSGIFSFHTHYDMVKQFHVGAEGKGICYIGNLKTPLPLEILQARVEILLEEFSEAGGIELLRQMAVGEKAITLENIAKAADWIADMEYFLLGLAINLGIPQDTVFLHVHDANMAKVMRPEGVIFRDDGKVLKPDGWVDPASKIFEAIRLQHQEDTTIPDAPSIPLP